jgi:hypothetical protein
MSSDAELIRILSVHDTPAALLPLPAEIIYED